MDSQKALYRKMSTINELELFVEKLKPYTHYQLNVLAFNSFNVYSQNAEQQFKTSESGKFFFRKWIPVLTSTKLLICLFIFNFGAFSNIIVKTVIG